SMGLLVQSVIFAPGMDDVGNDPIAVASAFVAIFTCVLMALLDSRIVNLSATCWSAGLLVLAGATVHPILTWSALQFSVLALLFYGRAADEQPSPSIWRSHAGILLGSVMFAAGVVLHITHIGSPVLQAFGMVMLLCG